jgi:hypothetical protein
LGFLADYRFVARLSNETHSLAIPNEARVATGASNHSPGYSALIGANPLRFIVHRGARNLKTRGISDNIPTGCLAYAIKYATDPQLEHRGIKSMSDAHWLAPLSVEVASPRLEIMGSPRG